MGVDMNDFTFERRKDFWTYLYRFKSKVSRIYWWFIHRFHPSHRYHVLNLGIEPGWHDIDYKMLHACFKLFCEFVEGENGLENLKGQYECMIPDQANDWGFTVEQAKEHYDRSKAIYDEAAYLYNWWKTIYPNIKDEIYMDNKLYEEENNHLIRLIKIRGYCWT